MTDNSLVRHFDLSDNISLINSLLFAILYLFNYHVIGNCKESVEYR